MINLKDLELLNKEYFNQKEKANKNVGELLNKINNKIKFEDFGIKTEFAKRESGEKLFLKISIKISRGYLVIFDKYPASWINAGHYNPKLSSEEIKKFREGLKEFLEKYRQIVFNMKEDYKVQAYILEKINKTIIEEVK